MESSIQLINCYELGIVLPTKVPEYFYCNKFSQMLLRPEGRIRRPLCFKSELSCLKQGSVSLPSFKKSAETFSLTLSILELLMDKSPHLAQQLLTMKRALTKWYEHIRQENIAKNRQIFDLKDKLVIGVKKQIGIVLEEIGYYLRSITQQYQDRNLQAYYVKYLTALKKLEWGTGSQNAEKTHHRQIQTDPQWSSAPLIPTQRSIERGSMSTIQSPSKKYKEVDMNKYIEVKQHNLQLQRKVDKLGALLQQTEEQNKKFRMELAHVLKQNGDLCQDSKKYLQDIEKLNEVLEKMKEQEEFKQRREDTIRASIQQTQDRYRKLDSLHEDLHRQLDHAEEEIYQKQAAIKKAEAEEYFNQNFKVENEPFFRTKRKNSIQNQEKPQLDEEYRMLMVQALAIEDFVRDNQQNDR